MDGEPPDFADWYATPLGVWTARTLGERVTAALPDGATARLLGLGWAAPLLAGVDRAKVERVALLVPAPADGEPPAPAAWPAAGANLVAVGSAARLPFGDALFDAALIVHALEFAAAPAGLLREVWRVLAPGGRLVLIVPSRIGVWARLGALPFGQGRAYGRGALRRLLADAMFEIVALDGALAAPPLEQLTWLDKPLGRLGPRAGNVHVAVATKTDGRAAPAGGGRVAAGMLRPAAEGA